MATKAIVGEKVGMTQVWDDDNRVIPVTVLKVAPARIVQVKTTERDGYSALQVTYGHKEAKKLTKPEAGHFAKADVAAGVRLVELRLDDIDGYPWARSSRPTSWRRASGSTPPPSAGARAGRV